VFYEKVRRCPDAALLRPPWTWPIGIKESNDYSVGVVVGNRL